MTRKQRDAATDPVMLRAKKDLTDPESGWILYSYLKPESVRAHPEATVRPWATCQVIGDALSFACTRVLLAPCSQVSSVW